jgi:hypothetical protein
MNASFMNSSRKNINYSKINKDSARKLNLSTERSSIFMIPKSSIANNVNSIEYNSIMNKDT